MTSKGILVECIEDMEIEFEDKNTMLFNKGIYYLSLIEDEIYIVDRLHKSIKIENNLFKKHFKIVTNG